MTFDHVINIGAESVFANMAAVSPMDDIQMEFEKAAGSNDQKEKFRDNTLEAQQWRKGPDLYSCPTAAERFC